MDKEEAVKHGGCASPIYRLHLIAQIKPTTQTRVDLGLALGKAKTPRRLIETGGLAKGDRITHRFEFTSPDQIDDEVRKWLKAAYDLDPSPSPRGRGKG